MSYNRKTKTVNSEERIDTIVGIITIVAVLALFAWFVVSMESRSQTLGQIASADEIRRGHEQTFSCEVKNDKVKNGDKVTWTVNGTKVAESIYDENTPLTLNYTPDRTGDTVIALKVGKYRQADIVRVLPPQLTLTAPNVVITYGDELPNLNYDCCGFVDQDCIENMCYDGSCAIAKETVSINAQGKLNAGVYRIEFDSPCCYKDYDVQYVQGTLTVLPKTLDIANNFVKTYDQTNVIETPEITLDGVVEGDSVTAKCDKLYFDNKNVGSDKTITLANVELEGEDCRNYVLQNETRGTITPKSITLDGMKAQDKFYDGTTKVSFNKAGTLRGVYEGDSVAIGNIDAHFDEAYVGERELLIDNVTLIGLDKDNYVLESVEAEKAQIMPR